MNDKCVFSKTKCNNAKAKTLKHDACRTCSMVPKMNRVESDEELKVLCGVAGQRDKLVDWYGKKPNESKFPKWHDKLLNNLIKIPCCDHIRINGDILISEPYFVSIDEIDKLIKLCNEHRLKFFIDGDSAHLPGRCFRIQIQPI